MSTVPCILYIEDERSMIELVRVALEMLGYKLVGATSGSEGLTIMRKHKPDLVLLDLMMPKPNGWQVYREMKEDAALVDIPVIIVTANISENDSALLSRDLPPVEDYITKPFDIIRLTRSIEKIVQQKTL